MSEEARPVMESDLLDISGEDDDSWLLQNTPNEGVSVLANTSAGSKNAYFNCSPLQIPRSKHSLAARPPFSTIGEVMGNKNTKQLSPSIVTDSVDKENISENKLELSKLSVERQQMKRKKKAAGFNLRKSLAWDRAFFTEEGVLDPVELSTISGNDCQTRGEMLLTIQEERRESILSSNCSHDSPGLRAIEENLFKELPVNSKNKGKKVVGGALSKNASPSKALSSLTQRKPLLAQDARSSSKRHGCPRPLASSSLKRPANVLMTKAQNKELRVSKVPATRSDPLKVANTVKKSTQGPSTGRQIQSAQSSMSFGTSKRNLGSTSSLKKTSSPQIKTKSNLASKSSIPKPSLKQARRNVIGIASNIPSASNSLHSMAVKSDDGPVATSDLARPGLSHTSDCRDANSCNVALSVPRSSCSSIENMLSAVPRIPRPSGLRMPSPSVGFFSQSKYPFHGLQQNNIQAIPGSDISNSATNYSSVPTFKKSQVVEKVLGVNTKASTGNISSIGSATVSSAPSRLVQPSHKNMKVDLKSTLEVELDLPCNPISSQTAERLQCPSIIQDNADKITLDNAALCKYEKISSEKGEELQSQNKTLPLCRNTNEQEDKTSDGKKDNKRKSCTTEADHTALQLKPGPIFEDSMDSDVQCSCDDKLKASDGYSPLKVSNQEGEDTFYSNDFNGDLDGLFAQGQPLNACLLPGSEDEVSICLSGENDILAVDHFNENVRKPHEVSDSCSAHPAPHEVFEPIISDVDHPSSSRNQLGNAESVLISSGPVGAQNCIKLPCNGHEENTVSDSIQCGHDIVRAGQVVLELEKTNKVRDSTAANCEADFVDTVPDCRERFRESEDQHFSCQLVPEVKEDDDEIDVMTRNETADNDYGPEMHIDWFSGSPVAEQKMEEVKLPMPFSPEIKIEDQTLKPSHEPLPERLTSEEYKESNCYNIANSSEEGVDLPIKQTDQLGPSDGYSAEEAIVSCSNDQPEITSEEGVDLHPNIANTSEGVDLPIKQTDQLGPFSSTNEASEAIVSCSNEQPEIIYVQKDIDLLIESDLTSHENELSVTGILKEVCPEVQATSTALNMSDKANALGTELNSSGASTSGDPANALGTELISSASSTSGDPESLSKDTDFSRIAECISKESDSGSVEVNNCVGKAERKTEIMIRTDKGSCAQVTDGSHKGEVQVLKNSPDPESFATREEQSGIPVSMNETLPVGDIVQLDEFNVLNVEKSIPENNGADASENSSSPKAEMLEESNYSTCASEDTDKMNPLDAKLEKRPDPLVVKPPPNAVPFSDEWLAAIEAAGEEILTLKTGAVQHSPPEKPAAEPGPWSPVKRKNHQGVGPFDCTKFTNKGLPPASD